MNYKINLSAKHILFIFAALTLYIGGASYQGFVVNIDMHKIDQSAYMNYAKKMKITNYKYNGDRNRMPVFPFLMSLVYFPNLSDEEFFLRGKAFNILLSIILLFFIFFIVQRYFTLLESLIFTSISAFSVYMFQDIFTYTHKWFLEQ